VRTVGFRKLHDISFRASAEKLRQGALWNDSLQPLSGGARIALARGVYRYASHEEADAAWREAIAVGMAQLARRRRDG
jgi:hypothetical protein